MFYLSWIDLHKASLPERPNAMNVVEDLQETNGRFWEMDTLRDAPEPNTVDETRPGYADLLQHARLGSLRGLMFTKAEVQLPC